MCANDKLSTAEHNALLHRLVAVRDKLLHITAETAN